MMLLMQSPNTAHPISSTTGRPVREHEPDRSRAPKGRDGDRADGTLRQSIKKETEHEAPDDADHARQRNRERGAVRAEQRREIADLVDEQPDLA